MADLIIVDDHPIFLKGLSQFLTLHDHQVVDCARSVDEALAILDGRQPDVLILDVSMKDGGGLKVLSTVRARGATMPVIFMTVSITPQQTLDAIRDGINGIVLKESDPAELLTCLEHVLRGETWIAPPVMEQALRFKATSDKPEPSAFEALTEREKEIAAFIKRGMRNRAIADLCGLSEGTVKVHLHSIFQKLGVKSRAELMVAMMQTDGS